METPEEADHDAQYTFFRENSNRRSLCECDSPGNNLNLIKSVTDTLR